METSVVPTKAERMAPVERQQNASAANGDPALLWNG